MREPTLLDVVTYSRNGRAVPRQEPTPQEWGTWAGRKYAVLLRNKIPPEQVRNAPPTWDEGRKSHVYPLREAWDALIAERRKLRALCLFTLASERVPLDHEGEPDEGSPWHSQAQRWVDVYLDLPGDDPPDTPETRRELQQLRDDQEVLRVRLAR
jgi:hypothetical protein